MDQPNENILNFYVAGNENKYKIAKEHYPRDYSVAEVTVLACLDALFRHDYLEEGQKDYDVHKVIRMIILDSIKDHLHLLNGSHKYDDIMKELYDNESKEAKLARVSVYNTMIGFQGDNEELNTLLKQFSTLQTQIRSGHKLWAAKGDRIESDLEHIYGTLLLIMGLESEYGHCVDYNEMYETMLIHETDEIKIGDPTEFDGYTPEQRRALADNAVNAVFGNTKNGKHYIKLLEGFEDKIRIINQQEFLVDKLEYDLQVKMYQLQGRYDFANRPVNQVTTSPRVRQIIEDGANNTFDVHYEYDKNRFREFPCLRRVLELAKNL